MSPERRRSGATPAGQWPALRIGDREREAAAARLADQYAEGRLDTDEHAERLDAIWSARTQADLDQLFWDLPAGPSRGAVPATAASSGGRRRRPLLWLVVALVLLSVVTDFPFWVFGIALWVFVVKHRQGGCAGGTHPSWR